MPNSNVLFLYFISISLIFISKIKSKFTAQQKKWRSNMKKILVEKTASRGVVVAPVFKYVEPDLTPDPRQILDNEINHEIEKFEEAKEKVIAELEKLAETNAVFFAHTEIANDYTLIEGIVSKIKSQLKNAELAVDETINEIATMFSLVDDPYMKERSADIKDVGKRYMSNLKNVVLPDLGVLSEEVVVIAKDMYPSDTVKINTKYVKGIITEEGGVTSHVFIIAKSMDIPILVGVGDILDVANDKELVCMDAKTGEIILDPNKENKDSFISRKNEFDENKARIEALRTKKIYTKEGKHVSLCANVGSLADIRNALPFNIDGVGLFRSEFLYMENIHFPSEEEQFKVYKEAAKLCPSELTIRTLDIGGDKELSYFEFDKEENPFLGYRAVRICLDMKDMFKEQLRAILRASNFGNVRIMIPMIISLEEIIKVKGIIEECKSELKEKGLEYNEDIEVGMMMETPASVLMASEFAKEVDFFSIGTNDLTQYMLVVDRGNKKIAELYDYFHPAVVSAIKQIITAGHEAGIKVGMCGEMAGDIKAVSMLMEMGLDEFSMSASSIDYVREKLLSETE